MYLNLFTFLKNFFFRSADLPLVTYVILSCVDYSNYSGSCMNHTLLESLEELLRPSFSSS